MSSPCVLLFPLFCWCPVSSAPFPPSAPPLSAPLSSIPPGNSRSRFKLNHFQNYRNETNELTEAGPHLLHKRALKRPKRPKARLSTADPKLYHGDRARFHYLQCLQLLFRKQAKALVRIWSLPAEFEIICRDVWALHLALLDEEIPAEPLNHAGPSQAASSTVGQSAAEQGQEGPDDDPFHSAEESSSSGEDDEDEDDKESESSEKSDLAKLLSEVSNSSEDESKPSPTAISAAAAAAAAKRKGKRGATLHKSRAATQRGNLAVLLCALWVLRVPATYGDLIRLVETYDLPYLAPLHHLPPELTLHLSMSAIKGLSPRFPPTAMRLHALASQLARGLAGFGILIPELNAAPVLWSVVRTLNGSPLLYMLSKKLLASLNVPLTLHPSLSALHAHLDPSQQSRKKHENIPAELALAAGVVLCLKLMYGLDGTGRAPREERDPLAGMPRVDEWLESLRREKERKDIYAAPSELSVLDMTDAEMDAYLDFSQRALVDPREGIDHPDQELKDEFFPLPSLPAAEPATPAVTYPPYSEFTATALSKDPDAVLPGNQHLIYSHLDKTGTIPEEYELVLQIVADWARVDLEDVLMVVETYERRLQRSWTEERRAAKRRRGPGAEAAAP
ncbi:hypothetical protein CALVIDRAFT_535544 [Calocera viscosa TUFC12733]|uniref:Uncharacterized protein n=1 Tax=Calocera viscosa (strain TUFC12733) TaxID=1330018 RepID=A0A167NQ66_CALVF|nr:hypothetical protein CALVIDRAFT_535544 [Calocera viscosa TUFC12733]